MLRGRDGGCQDRVVRCNMPPMPKRSLWVRTPLFFLTLLQFSVPAAAAWADARLGEPSGPAHIESHSTAGCARIHPADCAFHRYLSAPLARNPATVIRIREGRGYSNLHSQDPTDFPLAYPLVPTFSAGNAVNISGKLWSGSGEYVRAVQAPNGAAFTLRFSANGTAAVSPAVAPRLIALRIR